MRFEQELLKKLTIYATPKPNELISGSATVRKLTRDKLRSILMNLGTVLEEYSDEVMFVCQIRSGFLNLNPAVIALCLHGDTLYYIAYAKEGIFKQHTAEKAVKRILDEIEKRKRFPVLPVILLLFAILVIYAGGHMNDSIKDYNAVVSDYNAVAGECRALMEITSTENIANADLEFDNKKDVNTGLISVCCYMIEALKSGENPFDMEARTEALSEELDELLYTYVMMKQITDPDSEWVVGRLKTIPEIEEAAAVTEDHDPNGLLGKEGGYTSCIYFSSSRVDASLVTGDDVISRGTDGGGAIEVYENKDYAQARCEYLARFDSTLLYTGSYAILGTMVIRTSYTLDTKEQFELTSKITEAFTAIQ